MFQQEFDETVYGVKSCKEQALRGFGNRGSLKEPPPSADPMSSLLSLPLSSIAEKLAKLKVLSCNVSSANKGNAGRSVPE